MKLIYPACFYPCEEGGFTVVFPDLPGCVTEGDSISEALEMAVEASAGWLLSCVQDNETLPDSSDITKVKLEYNDGFVNLICIDLDEYAQKHGNKAIKKTLTIPAWLNTVAEKAGVNFSQVLQEALRERLGI
jgi:predicted RNase H-like HicB family nuclease